MDLSIIKKIGGFSIEDITALETHSLPHLKHLSLYNNNVIIIPSLEKYTNLKTLWLIENSIGRQGYRSIASLLQNKKSVLMHLDLRFNDIWQRGSRNTCQSTKQQHNIDKTLFVGQQIQRKRVDVIFEAP